MDHHKVQEHRPGLPYPRYLIDQVSRVLIDQMQNGGLSVELTAPALGSVAVTVTTEDGSTHVEQGRPEDLEQVIRAAAKRCGFDLDDV